LQLCGPLSLNLAFIVGARGIRLLQGFIEGRSRKRLIHNLRGYIERLTRRESDRPRQDQLLFSQTVPSDDQFLFARLKLNIGPQYVNRSRKPCVLLVGRLVEERFRGVALS
jgi:hypothetical protein